MKLTHTRAASRRTMHGAPTLPGTGNEGLPWSRLAIGLAAALASIAPHDAPLAAELAYPTRPVRMVVPNAPGGGTDAIARIMAPKLTEAFQQTWVVDNRGGASGNLGAEIVARSVPDGHTVLMGFGTFLTVNPSLYRLSYDVQRDLQPVALLATAQYILVVHASVPVKTLDELIALAKQKPRFLNYASSGPGSALHLSAELFKKRAGIDMVQIAYKGGGPAAAAVLAGEAHLLFGSVVSSLPHVKTGRLRALATTGLNRSKVAPELPTLAESGFPGFEVLSWYGMLVPAKTPSAIIQRLHAEAIKALDAADVQQAMSRLGLDTQRGTPAELAERIRTETAMWAAIVKEAGIRAE